VQGGWARHKKVCRWGEKVVVEPFAESDLDGSLISDVGLWQGREGGSDSRDRVLPADRGGRERKPTLDSGPGPGIRNSGHLLTAIEIETGE